MKHIGIILLVIGFLWIAWDAAEGFVGDQHTRWIWQSQQVQAGFNVWHVKWD